jgi:DNA mismatch repair protein MutL
MQQQNREIKTAISDQQSAISNGQQATDNGQSRDAMLASPATGNAAPTTGDASPATGNAQPATDNTEDTELANSVPWQSELSKLRSQMEATETAGGLLEYEQPKQHKLASLLIDAPLLQLHQTYIIAQGRQGFFLISQQAAHERILYEYLQQAMHGRPVSTQRSLFPTRLQLSLADAFLLEDLLPDLQQFGYLIEPAEDNSFVIQGTPADVPDGNETKAIEHVLEQFKHFSSDVKFSKREKLVRTMAWYQSIKPGRPLSDTEMRGLLEQLANCTTPNVSPGGNPVYVEYGMDQLGRMFGR